MLQNTHESLDRFPLERADQYPMHEYIDHKDTNGAVRMCPTDLYKVILSHACVGLCQLICIVLSLSMFVLVIMCLFVSYV